VEFIGLPELHLPAYGKAYGYKYDRLDPDLRAGLAARYAEPNHQLFDYLGTEFEWGR